MCITGEERRRWVVVSLCSGVTQRCFVQLGASVRICSWVLRWGLHQCLQCTQVVFHSKPVVIWVTWCMISLYHEIPPINHSTVAICSVATAMLNKKHIHTGMTGISWIVCPPQKLQSLAALCLMFKAVHLCVISEAFFQLHTHTPVNGPLSGTTWVSQYYKG